MSDVTAVSPTPRRIRPPSWLDARLLLGVVLVLASVLLGARVVSGAGHTDRMLAVSRDLAAGTVLRDSDVTSVEVRLPDHGRDLYLAAGTPVAGRQLARSVVQGELLPAAAIQSAAAMTTVTVPFADGAAPHLAAGQRIEVWLSTAACPAVVLLGDVAVQAVDTAGSASFGSGSGQNVVLGLTPVLAQRVVTALAIDSPVIRAGVLTGAADPRANEALPDISSCLPASS